MVVVAGRVLSPGLEQRVVGDDGAHLVEPLLIGAVGALLLVVESVQTDILQGARAGGGGKGVGLRGLLGNTAPLRRAERRGAVDGHAALVELLAVAQHVLAYLTEVDVEVARVLRGCARAALVDEGVHQPELHIFYISLLEVRRLQLAHHAAPLRRGVHQRAVGVQLGGQVVGAALLGVVGQVEHVELRRGAVVVRLVAVGVQLLDIDLAHAMVRELFEVALDVAGRETRRAVGEQLVDVVPRQQGATVAGARAGLVGGFGHHRGHARQRPGLRLLYRDEVLRVLEVIQI